MDPLMQAVRDYAAVHGNRDGIALTPVPGLRMMCVDSSRGDLHSVYRPLVCLVLQGAKRLTVGREERIVAAGELVIVGADMSPPLRQPQPRDLPALRRPSAPE